MDGVEWAEIGERVRECRLAAGMSQAVLAQETGLDRTMLAKIEAGVRRVDALELARFAAVLGVPMEDFLQERPLVLSRRMRLADQSEGTADPQAYRLDVTLQRWLRDVEQLRDLGVLRQQAPMIYPKTVDGEESAYDAARWLRRELGLRSEPIEALMTVCERAGQLMLVTDIPGDGASLFHGDMAVAVVSRGAAPGRRRATGAHELGHMVLGDEYSSDLGVAASRDERERVLDAFAAELLLPSDSLRQSASTRDVDVRTWLIKRAAEFRTSWSLAVRQAARAKLIDDVTARQLRQRAPTHAEFMDAMGWAPPVDLETVTVPPSYARAVIEAWRRDLVTSDRAVEMMYGEISGPDLPPRENVEQEP